jgi:hypothetical protein
VGEDGTTVIGPAGGVVAFGDAEVVFPPRAMPSCQAFTLAQVAVDALPEPGTLGSAYELSPAQPFERSVLLRLAGRDPVNQEIAYLSDTEWVPLPSIPSADRSQVWARSVRSALFAVRARPPRACPGDFCGGEIEGRWELSSACFPPLPIFCFSARTNVLGFTSVTFDGGRVRLASDVGPLSIFVPKGCLAENQASSCPELGLKAKEPGVVFDCVDISDSECGCTATYEPGQDRAVVAGAYAVSGAVVAFSRLQTVEGANRANPSAQNRFCRSGTSLAMSSGESPGVQFMRAAPSP